MSQVHFAPLQVHFCIVFLFSWFALLTVLFLAKALQSSPRIKRPESDVHQFGVQSGGFCSFPVSACQCIALREIQRLCFLWLQTIICTRVAFSQKLEAEAMTKQDVVKVALVGLGRAGHFHMQSILQLPGSVFLAWVVDVDTAKAQLIAAERGCRWSTDLDEALLPGPDAVDAVIVASATDTHFPYIMKALRADKAVLAEKPISHELHEVMEAVQLAKSRNLAFVCGYQRRADRHFRELKRHLDAGAIGNLKVLKTCSRDNPIPPMEYLRTSGGIFHDMLIHDFDMLDFLSGGQVPESVTAIGHSYNPEIKAMGDVDTCAVMFKYPSGLIAMVDTSRDASYGYDQRIEAFGEHGMLSAKNELTSTVELATAEGHLMPPAMYSFPQRYLQAYRSELTEFIELVQAGCDSQLHHLEQEAMLRHPNIVRTTLAAELSWKLGKTVAVAEVGQLKAEDVQMSDAVSTSSGSGELKEFWRTDSAVSGA